MIEFGPLDENEATYGVLLSIASTLLNIVAVGFLFKRLRYHIRMITISKNN